MNAFRELLNAPSFDELPLKPEFSMLGRTYASGFESDLDDWLLRRPRRVLLPRLHVGLHLRDVVGNVSLVRVEPIV